MSNKCLASSEVGPPTYFGSDSTGEDARGFLLRHLPRDSGLLCSQPFLSARGEHFDASTPNHASPGISRSSSMPTGGHGKRIVRAPWERVPDRWVV
jgi:hypothetical protein